MPENQPQVTPMEREIPVFTVLKNNCILKNIFVLDNPPEILTPSVAQNAYQESDAEETLVVGRHPDCNIKLEHPSISRFHLRIHCKPYSRSLSVTDLSSVHGTWISGKKIEAGIPVKLSEGDTLRLGESSRLYKLNWIPISYAYEIDNQFMPQLGDDYVVSDQAEGEIIQDENVSSFVIDQVQTLSDNMEGLELLFSDEDLGSSMQKGSPASLPVSQDTSDSFTEVENISFPGISLLQNDISSSEVCGFDKENSTLLAQSPLVAAPQRVAQHEIAVEASGIKSVKQSGLSIWSRRGKPESVCIETGQKKRTCGRSNVSLQVESLVDEFHKNHEDHLAIPYDREHVSSPDQENVSPNFLLVRSMNTTGDENGKGQSIVKSPFSSTEQDEEEIFTPDKENMTPNSRLQRSMTNRGKLEGVKYPVSFSNNSNMHCKQDLCSASVKERQNKQVLQERKLTNSASKSLCSKKKQPTVFKARTDRDPFCPMPVNSTSNESACSKPSVNELNMTSGRSATYPMSEAVIESHVLQNTATKVENNRWTIVVDTTSLLSTNSRKELQLLRGLRGTSMVIPRIVIRELDCMLRRGSFFRRTTEVSAALQWVEETMAIAKWWIHVQSSAEESSLIPPTPPASSHHWFPEDKTGPFSVGSTPFSPHSLQEIVTPTATDHILESAIFFKKIRTDGQLVLLTDDVTLKIKAMAEGVICETAEEFRRSLVSPFSARFLYSDSCPIGPSWSCADDVVLKEKYYPSPSKKLSKSGEGVKGLKLILHHNSKFGHTTPVSFTQV